MFYGSNLKKIRKSKKITQEALGKALCRTRVVVNKWENGRGDPCTSDIRMMANILGVGVEQISDLKPDYESIFIDRHLIHLKGITQEYGKGLSDIDIVAIKNLQDSVEGLRRENGRLKKRIRYKNSFLDSIDTYTYVIDNKFNFVDVNTTFLNYLDKFERDVLNNSWLKFFDFNEISEILEIQKEVFRAEKPIKNQKVKLPKNKIGLLSILPDEYDSYQNLTTAICTIKDITLEEELHKKQQQEEEKRKDVEAVINKINHMVWIGETIPGKKDSFFYTFISDNILDVYGVTKADGFKDNKLWEKLIHEDSIEEVNEWKKVDTLPKSINYKINHPKKGVRWVSSEIFKEKNNKYYGIIKDITEEKEKEIEKGYLFECLNSMDSAFWVAKQLNKKKNIFEYRTISKGIKKIFGKTKPEFMTDLTIWEKRINPDNIHSKNATSFETDYVLNKGDQKNEKWIHEIIHKKDNMLFGLTTDIAKSYFMDKGNKKLLEKAIDEISHGVILFSEDKKQCLYANNSAEKIFEIEKKDLLKSDIGKRIFDNIVFIKEEKECNQEKFCTVKYFINKKNKWLEIAEKPFTFYETKCILLMVKDATKEVEQENLQQLILHSLENSNLSFSIRKAKTGEFLFDVNANALFGIPNEIPLKDMKQYWLENIVHPKDKEKQKRYAINDNFPPIRQYSIMHPTKGHRQIEVHRQPAKLYNEDYIIVFMEDITDKTLYKK